MLALRCVCFFCAALMAGASAFAEEDEPQNEIWQEAAWQLPEAPQAKALLPFYVSATTNNKFFIDSASLSVEADGVVRYTLLVLAPEGGRNVSFEGVRCETSERRIYASGRLDGSWSKARGDQWLRIRDAGSNRYHAALFHGYFCPGGVIARNVEEILAALRRDAGFVERLR